MVIKTVVPMTFLVTGGSGFIGSGIVRALLKANHAVRAFYRPGDDPRLLEGLRVERIHGDICDVDSLALAASGCEGVFHTVGNMSFRKKDRPSQRRINVEGVRSVVESCMRSGVRRLVHTSTVNACGIPHPPGTLGDEETPFNWEKTDFFYAITKHEGERIALSANCRSLEVIVVNPGTVFGAGDIRFNAGGYIRAVQKMPILFHPAGGANCVHVDAVVEGHLAAFFRGRPGQRYILGGENLSYREIFATIASVLRRPRLLLPMPYPAAMASAALLASGASIAGFSFRLSPESVRAGYLKLYYSSTKATNELGLRLIPFRKAVEDAAAWYEKIDPMKTKKENLDDEKIDQSDKQAPHASDHDGLGPCRNERRRTRGNGPDRIRAGFDEGSRACERQNLDCGRKSHLH